MLWLLCMMGWAMAAELVAVLEMQGDGITTQTKAQLSETLRIEVRKRLPKEQYQILTKDNTERMLQQSGIDVRSVLSGSSLDFGSNIGARYILLGNVRQLSGQYVATITLYDGKSSDLLAGEELQGSSPLMLNAKLPHSTTMVLQQALGVQALSFGNDISVQISLPEPSGSRSLEQEMAYRKAQGEQLKEAESHIRKLAKKEWKLVRRYARGTPFGTDIILKRYIEKYAHARVNVGDQSVEVRVPQVTSAKRLLDSKYPKPAISLSQMLLVADASAELLEQDSYTDGQWTWCAGLGARWGQRYRGLHWRQDSLIMYQEQYQEERWGRQLRGDADLGIGLTWLDISAGGAISASELSSSVVDLEQSIFAHIPIKMTLSTSFLRWQNTWEPGWQLYGERVILTNSPEIWVLGHETRVRSELKTANEVWNLGIYAEQRHTGGGSWNTAGIRLGWF